MWNLKWVRFLMYCTIVMPTCCRISHCSGWSETETVTVESSARGRRGSRCAARMDGAMRPAVNCRGRAAKIKHWHWHTAAGVEVRTELWLQSCMLQNLLKETWNPFAFHELALEVLNAGNAELTTALLLDSNITLRDNLVFKLKHNILRWIEKMLPQRGERYG